MPKRRTIRGFADIAGNGRTGRLLRVVANELERLAVRWTAEDDESAYFDWENCSTVSPADADFKAVRFETPRGVSGCLLVHRAVLEA